jgi:LEA14-like dessication related protein
MLKCTRFMLLAFALGTAGCSLLAPKFERPTLSVASVAMVSGNLFQQNLLVTFDIQNPNDRALPVTSLHAELTVGGDRFASGVTNRAFVVPAHGATQFDMSITANMAMALVKLGQKSGQHSDSIDYDMTGAASIDLPFMRDLPFHQSGSFPLRLPR